MKRIVVAELFGPDLGIIQQALRGDVDMRRYVPEVHRVCHILGIDEPPWFEDDAVRDRVAATRGAPMVFEKDGTEIVQHRSQHDLPTTG